MPRKRKKFVTVTFDVLRSFCFEVIFTRQLKKDSQPLNPSFSKKLYKLKQTCGC